MKNYTYLSKPLYISTANVAGKTYILNEKNKNFIELNNVGGFIWGKVNGLRTVSEIIQELLLEYDISEDNLKAEVNDFLLLLKGKDLLEISDQKFEGIMVTE